jgi:5-oxoprolinase (ATP-hydrolysing)
MTNSRLTDPEILELRHPVRVESFAVRRGSGGAGRHRGGDGVVRRLRFTEAMHAALISNRRACRPSAWTAAPRAPGATGDPRRRHASRPARHRRVELRPATRWRSPRPAAADSDRRRDPAHGPRGSLLA